MQKRYLLVSLLCSFSCHVLCQQVTTQPKQVWPQVDIFYKWNDRFRMLGRIRSTYLNQANTDGTLGLYVDYFAFPIFRHRNVERLTDTLRGEYLWFRGGYSYSNSPPGAAKVVDQHIIETTVNARYFLPWNILMIFRNRFDWVFDNGYFNPRYRARIRFDRNFRTAYLFFNVYFYGEYFFFFRNNSQDRFRIEIGYEVKVLKTLSFQTYYLHQFPNDGFVAAIDAIGLQANFFFKKKSKP